MEKNGKCIYKAPDAVALEGWQESAICDSGTRTGYGNEIEDDWA